MANLPAPTLKDCVNYLVVRRFPFARFSDYPPSLGSRRVFEDGFSEEDRAKVESYRTELNGLPLNELMARLNDERAKEAEENRAKAEREEQERSFNQPYALADFDHWSRAAHWTLDEAIALSFGKAPELVSWERVKPYIGVSPFAAQYARRRDLALRAAQWQQLFDPVLPGIFLAWCKRTDIPIPSELEAAVTARGIQVADWHKLYEDSQAAAEKSNKEWAEFVQKQRDDWSGLVKGRDELIASLNARITELEAQLSRPQDHGAEKPLGTRERDSLLKLVIGMAIGGYGFDPKVARSEKPAEITSDLAANGLTLDVDTVRKWLAQARELLPRDQGVNS